MMIRRVREIRWRVLLRGLVAFAACAVTLSGCFGSGSHHHPSEPRPAPPPPLVGATGGAGGTVTPPNIVFVLTDDLSSDLVQYMPAVQALARNGMTFDDYFVSDSLCCPSRSSIFTGDFPHNSGVFSNVGRYGGFQTFYDRGDQNGSFNIALRQHGYATALMGKYINGYLEPKLTTVPRTYVPPGWTEWDVGGYGYPEFNYKLNQDGHLYRYGDQPQDYLTDVIARRGVQFIDTAAQTHRPFFLELSTFAPHRPYTPAPRDAQDFPGLTAARPPNFNAMEANAPRWLAGRPPLSSAEIAEIDDAVRKRAQSVQAVDDMIRNVESALAAHGLTQNTYIVFSSDNGLHTGEYRLTPGKLTAFDTDIHVPLIVAGPGVPAGSHTTAMAQNIDLAATFAAMAGTDTSGDGHSLLPLLDGHQPDGWRNTILVEHRGPAVDALDPDRQGPGSGNPNSYEAIRTSGFLYVQYADGELEYHALSTDPYELDNQAGELSIAQFALLRHILGGLADCQGAPSCWAAAHIPPSTLQLLDQPAGPGATLAAVHRHRHHHRHHHRRQHRRHHR
jgi:arylsulfatase A-like enzyme